MLPHVFLPVLIALLFVAGPALVQSPAPSGPAIQVASGQLSMGSGTRKGLAMYEISVLQPRGRLREGARLAGSISGGWDS